VSPIGLATSPDPEVKMNLAECISPAVIREILETWPSVSREAATTMMDKYGLPSEASAGPNLA
jgi:hypothetical protein